MTRIRSRRLIDREDGSCDQHAYDPDMPTLCIEPRFIGPAGSGNGGWGVWELASRIDEPVTVALRAPIPLGVDLSITKVDDTWHLVDPASSPSPTTVLTATPWAPRFADTTPLSVEEARAARDSFPYTADEHPAPDCFSCGAGVDSMQVHPGTLSDGRMATDWRVPDWAKMGHSQMAEGALWAALDCTSAWFVCGAGDELRMAFTVQFACEVVAPLSVDTPYALVAWGGEDDNGWDGRKRHAASAAFDGDGNCVARSVSLWVAVADPN